MACDGISEVLSTFEKSVENLGEFSEAVQSDTQNVFKSIAKTFSDSLQQKSCSEEVSYQNLPPLIIENFVDEQIWQQLELRNAPITEYLHKYFKTFDSFTFGVKNSRSQECNISQTTDVDMSSEEGSDYSFEESDDDDSEQKNFDERSEIESQQTLKEHRKFNPSLSVFDDKFFRVSQLEEFLKLSDLKEERGQDDVGSDESEIDLFADIPSGDEATDDGDCGRESTKKQKSSREVMYKDFFDPPEGDNESLANQESDIHSNIKDFENRDWHLSKEKTVRFSQDIKADKKLQLLDDSDDDSIPNENPGYEKSSSNSTFERFREKEHKQIQKLQESSLREKPWQFTGEIVCGIRPQDSLLPENIEFTSNLKPDFLSTEEVSGRIDNIIMKAMENQAWCDVEIKVRPVEDVFKYKYTEPLNQAKSEKSLAEVYEEEYNKMKMGNENEEEKEDPRHTEIRKLMDSVASTLSNLFSHTPRPPMPEIKVVNNMPAITLEEVAPIGVSDAALLAPEEIKSTSGLPVGKSERSETDKKRERRKKKKLQKIRKIEKEERDRKKAAVSKKAANKFAKQQALKKLSQQKNVTIVQDKKRQRRS